MSRRDPSPVLRAGGRYYEWPYTRHPGNRARLRPRGVRVAARRRHRLHRRPLRPAEQHPAYSADGVRFRQVRAIEPPRGPDPYREDRWREGSAPGIAWGLCQNTATPWPCLQRFDADLRAPRASGATSSR